MNDNYEEVEYIEIETPLCWGYMDLKDQSCQRCGIKEYCEDEQEATRPGCYGLFQDERNEECARCLDESQCVEYQLLLKQGDETMATKVALRKKPRPKRRRPPAEQEEVVEEKAAAAPKPARRRKAKPVAKPAPKPEPEVEDEKSDGDYDQWEMRELREELKERDLATRGNKAKLIMRLLADDNADEDGDDEPESEPPAPKPARRGRKAKAVLEPEEVADEDGPGLFVESDMATFIDSVGVGQSVVATRIDDDTWSFAIVAGGAPVVAKATGRGLRGKAYAEEVLTEEFLHFDNVDAAESGKSWREMTVEEREELAAEFDVEIDEDRPKVRAMQLKPALMAALGIEKYKDEYKSRAARKALKDGV